MSETYLFRVKVDFNWEYEENDKRIKAPQNLPKSFGPFLIDHSPNAHFYLVDLGLVNELPVEGSASDNSYPISLLDIEFKIDVEKGKIPNEEADLVIEQLEAMMRLHQEGDITLRRHYYHTWRVKEEELQRVLFLRDPPIKPEPATLYQRKQYKLGDNDLEEFIEFYNLYWDIINNKTQPMYNALIRFNSSYERRTLGDRVIELMIGMEALFGDESYHSYKIPLRCACMLYPPNESRKEAFTLIKYFYHERSAIVHGDKLDLNANNVAKVDKFEEYTRKSIKQLLKLHKEGHQITSGSKIDDLLFFNEIS